MKRVGLIGCGVVGRRLGARLLRAGFDLSVHDRHADRVSALRALGAVAVDDPASLGSESDVLVSSLPDPDEALAALAGPDGAWSAARASLIHVDTSTIGVACARTLASKAEARRIRYLDAPLSAAEAGDTGPTLALFVSGHADHYDLAKPVLQAMAEHVHYLGGPAGVGQIVKLVNNLTSHCLTVVLGEAIAMGLKAGVPIEMIRAALHDGTAQCRLLDESLPATALCGDWRPGLRLELALKDLSLAEELARESGVEQTVLREVRAIYERARDRGWGDLGAHAVWRLTEETAGVSFRSDIFRRMADLDDDVDGPRAEP